MCSQVRYILRGREGRRQPSLFESNGRRAGANVHHRGHNQGTQKRGRAQESVVRAGVGRRQGGQTPSPFEKSQGGAVWGPGPPTCVCITVAMPREGGLGRVGL